jgi:radical SAM superfamily enzyme YgiQ (UPF0313 family)/intein/homing endonuclease
MCATPSAFLLDERVFMSLGILKVAAALEKAGHTIEFLDLSGIENYLDVVEVQARKTTARVVCLTATTPQLPAATAIVERIRSVRPDLRIILGGPHVTLVCAAVKLEKKAGRTGRAHTALTRLEALFDVLVAGDGELAVFDAIAPEAPKIVDGDDPRGGLFMTNAIYDESPMPARHLVDVGSYRYTIDGHKATSIIAQLGCPFACGFSVTGDTLVLTDRGFERIEAMATGAFEIERCEHGGSVHSFKLNRSVYTADGSSLADSVVHEGKRKVFEVRTENGLRLRGTSEHPLMSLVDGVPTWKEIRDLHVGDWLVLKSPDRVWPAKYVSLRAPTNLREIPPGGFQRKPSITPKFLTEDLAWLAGYLIGDGCLPADGRPSVHVCVFDENRTKLSRIVNKNFGVKLAISKSSVTDKMDHGWIHSRAVYEFFVQSMGISPTDKLHVPESVLRSPRAVVEAFLQGLWDADGYDSGNGNPYLTTVSNDLAKEVAHLILMLGDPPNIQEIRPCGYGTNVMYRVGRLKNDRIPTDRALYFSKKSWKWFWRTPRNKKTFLGIRRRTLRESGLKHDLDRDGWHYVRVEHLSEGIVEDVYDLRVPGEHCFVANGIISHNCGGRNSSMLRKIRTRTTESVLREIELLYRTYGITGVQMYDDELNVSRTMVELMDGIADLQDRLGVEFRLRGFVKSELFTDEQAAAMYRAGFRWILCGFEAAHPRILENINKKATLEDNTRVVEICRRHDLKVKALMSVGHPGETNESILAVRDWLLDVKPDDFDCTVITTYPGTPYYDEAIPHTELPDVWTYTCKKSGDRLHAYDVDFTKVAEYYKGDPEGGYHSYVFTDHLSAEEIVRLRDEVESTVRERLGIPFNPGAAAVRYEHSMGQGALPGFVLRTSKAT